MNIREKLCMQLGGLMLTNMEISDQLEQALTNTSAKDAKIDELQKSVEALKASTKDAPAAAGDATAAA